MFSSQSKCFISDSKICQTSNPKNLVFIIGSGSNEFKKDIDIIKKVLNGFNLKGYFALWSEKEIGLDAFCTKICSKIQESKFCIALLNNPLTKIQDELPSRSESIRAPSANVYFEFGMAIALEKPVIPIIRHDLKLPFDVRQLDTIIYHNSSDLRRKLKARILPILSKEKKEFRTKNYKLIEKIYEPLSSILQKHVAELETFGYVSTYEISDILDKEAYYTAKMPSDLLKRLENYIDQVELWKKKEYYARLAMVNIVNETILKFLDKPVSPANNLHKIELIAISSSGSKTQLQVQDIFRLLLENKKIESFLKETYWTDTYERISIKYSNEPSIELKLTEFSKKIWDKCLAKVAEDAEVSEFKESTKSVQKEAKEILEEITKS